MENYTFALSRFVPNESISSVIKNVTINSILCMICKCEVNLTHVLMPRKSSDMISVYVWVFSSMKLYRYTAHSVTCFCLWCKCTLNLCAMSEFTLGKICAEILLYFPLMWHFFVSL